MIIQVVEMLILFKIWKKYMLLLDKLWKSKVKICFVIHL